ncbi:MAG: helix-turn-helix domain-containing protein [Candidatus Neomarinimicrobiota bacterium]
MNDYAILEKLNEIGILLKGKIGDPWMNIKEVCRYCCLSESTVRRAIQRGELKVSPSTGRNIFRKSWVDRWLNG